MPPSAHHALATPSAWVTRHALRMPAGEVLDLACGAGRHAHWLAAQGWTVLAVDRDEDALALAAGEGIVTLATDLEAGRAWPFGEARFAGIVVTNYLHRPLFPDLFSSLAPGGVLIYETFAVGNEQFGKPSNPDFLLARGELLQRVMAAPGAPWHVLAYEDGCIDHPKPAMVQRLCARKPGPADGAADLRRQFALD